LHPHLSVQLVRMTSVEDYFSRQVDCALLPGDVVGATLAGRELRPGRIVLVASPHLPRAAWHAGTARRAAATSLHYARPARWPGATLAVQVRGWPR
jgi:DNA-binding transcriptional LysR family regulator